MAITKQLTCTWCSSMNFCFDAIKLKKDYTIFLFDLWKASHLEVMWIIAWETYENHVRQPEFPCTDIVMHTW